MSLSELKELFAEIGKYIYDHYICLDLSRYNNFSLGAKNTLIAQIVICFIVGSVVASILMYLEKTQTTKLISALIRAECKDEESAKSPTELNVRMTGSLIRRMRQPSPLSKLVYYRGQKIPVATSLLLQKTEDSDEKQENDGSLDAQPSDSSQNMVENGNNKSVYATRAELIRERRTVDFQNTPLYIPNELYYRAQVRYGEKNRPWILVLSLIALPILGILILRVFPTVLLLADGMITFFN